ncbi:DNA helicase [Tanacetum coccineum]
MFSMTSLGDNIDTSINNGRGPYVFRIAGQIYHWIGSMCPAEGDMPRFLQLYIYDTTNEVHNRMAHFGGEEQSGLKREIVDGLIDLLDNHNALVKLFCTARNKRTEVNIPEFKLRLYNVIGTRRYDLPTPETIGAIIFGGRTSMESEFDLIVKEQSCGGKLFQQYAVTAYCTVEQTRLDYIRQNQNEIRNEYLSGIYDAIIRDALAICRIHGNPSFFITFTCNAKWPEIQEYIDSYRADIVDRVFELKVRDYIKFVRSAKPFGDITAILYTIEFQKCGLPHCHSLLWVSPASKVQQDTDVDKYISAELPDPTQDPDRYIIISELMIHGTCGYANKNASCMKDGNNAIKIFQNHTMMRLTLIKMDLSITVEDIPMLIQKGSRSFREIQTVNGIVFPINRAACEALGLIGSDEEWVTALEEEALHASSDQLRKLFVQILMFCDVSHPTQLWQKIWKKMSHDIPRRISRLLQIPRVEENETKMKGGTLFEIEAILNSTSRTLKDFGLPMPPRKLLHILETEL